MPADLAKDFLRRHPPFFYLQDDELRGLVRAAREEFVRKGDALPDAGASLVIVRQGAVAELAGADDRMIELRDEGSVFGLTPAGEAEAIRRVAHEDSILLQFPRAQVEALTQSNERFADYFSRRDRHRKRFLAGLRADLAVHASGSANPAGLERLLFTTAVRELCRREPVWCLPETSVRDAARLMRDRGVSSVLVLPKPEDWRQGGIVTNDDLRTRVLAEARDVGTPVSAIMSRPLRTIEGDRFAFEALLAMIQGGMNFLPVVWEDRDRKSVV